MSVDDPKDAYRFSVGGVARPGIVIFTAILNLLNAFFTYLATVSLLLLGFLSSATGLRESLITYANRLIPNINWSLGINFVFGFAIALTALLATLPLLLGLWLLRGKTFAWYLQVAMSILGLFAVPFGTVINAVILAMFFKPNVRSHFKVV